MSPTLLQKTPSDPIDPGFAALLALYQGPLEAVRFPDVDAEVLASIAEAVRTSAAEVAAAQAALVAAQITLMAAEQALVANEHALVVRGQRALAYARVFAEGDPALRDALGAITFAGAAPPHDTPVVVAPRRRGRPRKIRDEGARDESQLFRAPTADAVLRLAANDGAVAAE